MRLLRSAFMVKTFVKPSMYQHTREPVLIFSVRWVRNVILRELLRQSMPPPPPEDGDALPAPPAASKPALAPQKAAKAPKATKQAAKLPSAPPAGPRWQLSNLFSRSPKPPALPVPEPSVPLVVYVASFVLNLLALGLPLVIMQVYDRVLPNRSFDTLSLMIIGLSGILVLDLLLKTIRAYLTGWMAARFNHTATVAAMERLMKAPYNATEKDSPTVHMARLAALSSIADFHGGASRLMVIDMPFVTIFLAMLAFVGGTMVLVPLGLFAVFALIAAKRNKALRLILEERTQQDERKYDFVTEAISGIHTIKTFAMEPQMMRRFERLQQAVAVTTHRSIITGGEAQAMSVVYGNISQIIVVSIGATQVIDQNLSMGALACCTLLSGQVLQPLLRGMALWSELGSLAIKRNHAAHLFELPAPLNAPVAVSTSTLRGALELNHVVVNEGGEARVPLLTVDTLAIAPGTIAGIRGTGSSAASTLVRLVMGDLAPASGTVRVDGLDPCGPEGAALRNAMAYVGAQAIMFRASIIDNIALFAHGRDRDAALEAARLVGLEEDIHLLPEGYDTKLGDGIAQNFPASFLQRIAIARAIARRPRVLVFDEVNALLDRKSDLALMRALDALRGRLTVLIVSQRPSFLACADVVWGFEGDRLVATQRSAPPPAPPAQQEAVS